MRRSWPDLPTHWPAAAVLVLCAILYTWRLDYTPPYFGGDEAHFAVHGHALATTGHNLGGTRMPLFVNLSDPQADRHEPGFHSRWYQPVLFYLIAAVLQVAPLTETVVRLPVALIAGVVSPLLLYLVAWRLFARRWVALLAALLLAWSPTNLTLGRQARLPASTAVCARMAVVPDGRHPPWRRGVAGLVRTAPRNRLLQLYRLVDFHAGMPVARRLGTTHGQVHLLDRTRYVDEGDGELEGAPAGSLLVIYDTTRWRQRLIDSGLWTLEREVHDLDDRPAALILRRSAPAEK